MEMGALLLLQFSLLLAPNFQLFGMDIAAYKTMEYASKTSHIHVALKGLNHCITFYVMVVMVMETKYGQTITPLRIVLLSFCF